MELSKKTSIASPITYKVERGQSLLQGGTKAHIAHLKQAERPYVEATA